ncbi:hypothetical protein KC315_g1580 [Hortaea werneckii]|nr:hypothetical protein KC315_g1580 [Hortaea werneckii]
MRVPVTHTQSLVLERPPFGHIADDYIIDCKRTWNPQGGHVDIPLKLPPTDLVVSIRRFKKLKKDYDATSEPTTVTLQNTDPPDRFFNEWMEQDPTLLRAVNRMIIRSDWINGLGGVNRRIYRYVVEMVPDPADAPNTALASAMGGLPFGPQLSQQVETWNGVRRPSTLMYGNPQAGPSNESRTTRYMPETRPFEQTAPPREQMSGIPPQQSSYRPQPSQQAETWNGRSRPIGPMHDNSHAWSSNRGRPTPLMLETSPFPQTVSSRAQMPGVPSQNPRSSAPDMRQSQQPERDQFGRPIMTYEDVRPANQSRPSIRRPRNPPPTAPMGSTPFVRVGSIKRWSLEIYLKPHGVNSERFRLCEKPGIQIGQNFKTAWVYTQTEIDRMFDIVIRFGKEFNLDSANVVEVDIRAGKGQTNHCFKEAAVFGIQTSRVQGQQHVINGFTAEACRFARLIYGSDYNPAEPRVCSPKSMKGFKALAGQEGDPYIAEFRPLISSKRPTSWPETDNETTDTTESSTTQPDDRDESLQKETLPHIAFCDCPKNHTLKQHSKSRKTRLRPRPVDRSEGPDSPPQTPKADLLNQCQSCKACGNPKGARKNRDAYRRQMQKHHASQRGDYEQTETPGTKRVPSAPSTVQHPRDLQATESPARRSKDFSAGLADDKEFPSDGEPLPANPRKRKRNCQAGKQSAASLGPETSPRVGMAIAGQQQSLEASSSHDGGDTPNLGDRSGSQASELPSTAGFDSRSGDDDENLPIKLARDSSLQFTRDSSVQLAEVSHMQFEEEGPGSSNLNEGDRQPTPESAKRLLTQRATTADITSGFSDANSQIGLEMHRTEVSNPHEAATSSQQTHMALERDSNEAIRKYTEKSTRRTDAMLGLPTSSSYTEHGVLGYPTSAPQQQLHPTSNEDIDNTYGQHEQRHSRSSISRGQGSRGEQYATPVSSDGHQHRRESIVTDQRTIANTPAPSVDSAGSSSRPPAPRNHVVDLTNSDDDSPSSANNRPAIKTTTDSDEEDKEELAEIQGARLMLKKEMEDLILKKKEELLLKRINRRARRPIKSEPSSIVKSEQ